MTDDRVLYRADDPGGAPMIALPSWFRYCLGLGGALFAIAAMAYEIQRQLAGGEPGVTLFAALAGALGLISLLYAMEAMHDVQ